VAVFLIADDQWREHDWAPIKVDFIQRTLRELSERLAVRNIPLLIRHAPRFDDAPAVLLEVARDHDCHALFFNREYEVNEKRRDEAVERAFEKDGREAHAFHDQTILAPDSVRTNDDGFYSVFTPFKKRWLSNARDLGVGETRPMPQKQKPISIKADPVPEQLGSFEEAQSRWSEHWPAGESNAKRSLTAFIEHRVRDYDDQRDLPAIDGTSQLSHFLALGVLSPRQCLAGALEANHNRLSGGAKGIDTWISELVWREFYRHVLVGWPRVSMHRPFRLESQAVEWREAPGDLQAWKDGRTGFPIVDAGMRQLAEIGWMHNRVRMVAATLLTKHLLIDWREGERHFMRNLIDGDLASNNGGWQWSASTGTDAAPYFRIFTPYSQSKRFDPDGEYIRRWVHELRDLPTAELHRERDPDDLFAGSDGANAYPPPLVNQKAARQRAIDVFRSAFSDKD
jgi:deoxyribodipyrimidine photo-lyase